jgi:hypothetical protein
LVHRRLEKLVERFRRLEMRSFGPYSEKYMFDDARRGVGVVLKLHLRCFGEAGVAIADEALESVLVTAPQLGEYVTVEGSGVRVHCNLLLAEGLYPTLMRSDLATGGHLDDLE